MTQTTAYPVAAAPVRRSPSLLDRLLRDTAYTLSALPIGILTFSVVVAGLSAGLGLVVVWVGVPILIGTLFAARAFAHLERIRLRSCWAARRRHPSTSSPATRPARSVGCSPRCATRSRGSTPPGASSPS